jgi:type I restriction enzyme S subunit
MKRKGFSTTENTARTEVDAAPSGHSVANTEDLPDGFQMTELGPLPKEWRVVRLGEVALLERGLSWSKADEGSNGIGVLSIPDILTNGRLNPFPRVHLHKQVPSNKLLVKGDILLVGSSGSAENVGRSGILGEEPASPLAFASFTIRLRGKPDALLQDFAFYLIQSTWIDFAHFSKRAADGKYNLQLRQLQSALIPLPPLPEQRAIAHVLRTVERAKEATEGVIAALKELKKSLMQHLFTYGPVPVTERGRVPLQETEIGPIPAHWRVVRLGELVEKRLLLIRGGFPQGQHNEVGNGVPHLRPFNITNDGNLDLSQVKYVAPPSEDDPHWLLPNDVIFNNTNSEELVGKTALFDRDGRFVLSNHMTLIRILEPNQVDAFWLSRQLHYFWYLGLYKSLCRRHVNQASISLERLKGISIPFPPFDEQCKIARILQALDAKIAAEERRRAALEELFKTLLHALMSGRIRVPHIVGGERSCDSNPDADKLPKSED